jgi:hypothetical protein
MNPHFVGILKLFHDEDVEFLVIGAHALAAHGHVRATLDIGLWVRPTADMRTAKRAAGRLKDLADLEELG